MKFTKVSPIAWEGVREPYDFHVRVEDGEYIVDMFRHGIEDPDEAYIDSERFETREEVEDFCDAQPGDAFGIHVPTKH